MKINPIINYNLDILFVGINPVRKSIKNGKYHYFSSNSYFYTLLKEASITDKKINSEQLLQYKLGIINYYYNYFGKNYKKLSKKENYVSKYFLHFINIINEYSPKKIVFLGKYLTKKITGKLNFGFLYKNAGIEFYSVPFPTYPMKKDEKLKYYMELK